MQSSTRPPSKTKPSSWVGPSHVSTFIRNLKLVHLDDLADWPDITLRTFSSSSQQNQRQRIKSVEWALYYLFTIWDPETAHNKLRPFFPPLEPLQSLNLRAALFRALSELKKNGDLGRETILRKTMLDECKGDKFEEVLAIFSTTVLRKFLSKSGLTDNPAARLATASHLTSMDQDALLPLVMAHRASLSSMLSDKAQSQGYYDQLCQLLDSKAAELSGRTDHIPQPSTEADPDSAGICRAVKSAWFGNEEWADAILQGGVQVVTDNMFELPFEETWSRVKKGEVRGRGCKSSRDLLVELDGRIEQQKTRLSRWREFRTVLDKRSNSQHPVRDAKPSPSPLLFREHQSLTAATICRSSRNLDGQPDQGAEYKCLVSAMNASLADLKGDSARNHTPLTSTREAVHRIEEASSSPVESDTGSVSSMRRSTPPESPVEAEASAEPHSDRDSHDASSEEEIQPLNNKNLTIRGNRARFRNAPANPWSTNERAERLETMKEDAESENTGHRLSQPPLASLLERTRQSMSMLPPPSAGPRYSINAKSRQSQVFPINQFETPIKPIREADPGTTTPKEELFDADYASVFKSRPKIATSPVVSPMVHMQSLDNIDQTLDFNLSELDLGSSPSARTRV